MIRGSTRHPVSVYTRCFISVYGIVMALGVNAEMPPEGTIRKYDGGWFIMFDGKRTNTNYAVVITDPNFPEGGDLVWWSLSSNKEVDDYWEIEEELNSDEQPVEGMRLSPTGIFDCVGPKGEKFGNFEVIKPVNFLNVNPKTMRNITANNFDCAKFDDLKMKDGRKLAYPGDYMGNMLPDFTWEPETPDEPDQGRGKWVGGAAFEGETWKAPDWTMSRKLTCTKRSDPVPEPSTVTPPIPKPIDESTVIPKPIDESTVIPKPAIEPTGTPKPSAGPTGTPKPSAEPTGTPKPIDVTTKPIDGSTGTTKPIDEPTSESSPKSSAEQSPKPTNEPATTTTGEPTTKPTEKPSPKPFYCRAWFFIVIAVVVAVVGAIVFVVLTKCMGEEEDDDDYDYSSSSSDSDEEKKQQEEGVELDSDSDEEGNQQEVE